MAANKKIRGITIEIGGDTTKLDKALTDVDKQSKTTQAALKEVNKLLKLDPTNTELLRQKQELLAQSAEETARRYELLKKAVDTATPDNARYEQWLSKEKALQGELDRTTQEVKELEKQVAQMEDLGFAPDPAFLGRYQAELDEARERAESLRQQLVDTYDEMGRPLPVDEVDRLKRELEGVTQQLESATEAAQSFSPEMAVSAARAQDFAKQMNDASGEAQKVSDTFAPVSKVIAGVGAAALATVPATDELRSGLSKVEASAQNAGVSLETTEQAVRRFNAVSGDSSASIEAVSNLIAAGFDDSNMLQALDELAGAAIKFQETMNIESLADSLQETIATGEATGQFGELLERLGVNLDDFNKKMAVATTEEHKQMLAMQELARNGLGELTQSWLDNNQALVGNRNATYDFQIASAQLAETMLPLMTKLTDMVSNLVNWFSDLPDGVQKTIIVVAALLALISPAAGIIASIATAMGGFAAASAAAAAGGTAVSLSIGTIITAVIALVAILTVAVALLTSFFNKGKDVEGLDVDSLTSNTGQKGKVRGFATGGVFEPNSPMVIGVGDNMREREILAPESALIDTFNRALDARGGGGGPITVNIRFTGSLSQIGRLMTPVITTEMGRQGPSLAPGTGGNY